MATSVCGAATGEYMKYSNGRMRSVVMGLHRVRLQVYEEHSYGHTRSVAMVVHTYGEYRYGHMIYTWGVTFKAEMFWANSRLFHCIPHSQVAPISNERGIDCSRTCIDHTKLECMNCKWSHKSLLYLHKAAILTCNSPFRCWWKGILQQYRTNSAKWEASEETPLPQLFCYYQQWCFFCCICHSVQWRWVHFVWCGGGTFQSLSNRPVARNLGM